LEKKQELNENNITSDLETDVSPELETLTKIIIMMALYRLVPEVE